MRRFVLSLALVGLAWSQAASAQLVVIPHSVEALMSCDANEAIYTAASTDAPAPIAHSFVGRGKDVSFRTCRDADGNTHYFIRKPRPNRHGICRVVEDEIFPGSETDFVIVDVLYDGTSPGWYFDLHGWTFRPPHAWSEMDYRARHTSLALVTDDADPCPATDNAGYIPVAGTDGLIKTFFVRWRAMTASPEALDRALAAIPVLPAPPFPVGDPERRRHSLRIAVFERHEQVAAIDCDQQELGTEGGCDAFVGLFSISFDVTEKGLVITGIRENPVV